MKPDRSGRLPSQSGRRRRCGTRSRPLRLSLRPAEVGAFVDIASPALFSARRQKVHVPTRCRHCKADKCGNAADESLLHVCSARVPHSEFVATPGTAHARSIMRRVPGKPASRTPSGRVEFDGGHVAFRASLFLLKRRVTPAVAQ
jgi:hypothetical protein